MQTLFPLDSHRAILNERARSKFFAGFLIQLSLVAMAQSFCRSFLGMLLKSFNLVQAFFGFSLLLYSVWLLNYWVLHRQEDARKVFDHSPDLLHLPWLVYFFMGSGLVVCLIAFIGNSATQAVNGCCLYLYAVSTALLILLEAALLADMVLNKHWQKDLPFDSTGQLENLQEFFKAYADLCQLISVVIVVVQALSILFALILRAMVRPSRVGYEDDENIVDRRKALLNPQSSYTIANSHLNNAALSSNIWISKMRQKYGLNPNQHFYEAGDPMA